MGDERVEQAARAPQHDALRRQRRKLGGDSSERGEIGGAGCAIGCDQPFGLGHFARIGLAGRMRAVGFVRDNEQVLAIGEVRRIDDVEAGGGDHAHQRAAEK